MMPLPVWLQPGPAETLYKEYLRQKTIKAEWVEIVRARWGQIQPDWSMLYPSIHYTTKNIPINDSQTIPVTYFTPANPHRGIIIYLHGGGWIAPASGKHLAWAQKLSYLTHMQVLSIEYSLAPEFPFPKAFNECTAIYQFVNKEFVNHPIYVVGDSAGANLGIATTLYCSNYNDISSPHKLICLCPVTDIFFEKYASIEENGINNPYFDATYLAFERAAYLPHYQDWENIYACPMRADLKKLPSTLILAAGDDPLRDENRAFAEKIKNDGGTVRFYLHPHMPHTFFMNPQLLPKEAELANQQIITFIKEG